MREVSGILASVAVMTFHTELSSAGSDMDDDMGDFIVEDSDSDDNRSEGADDYNNDELEGVRPRGIEGATISMIPLWFRV